MLTLFIPDNFYQERRYAASFLLSDLLGLDLQFKAHSNPDYILQLPEGKSLILRDHFFCKLGKEDKFLDELKVPSSVKWVRSSFASEENIPVIFGTDELNLSEQQIVCGIDFMATTFFMLTRWEEMINKRRDRLGRFPAEESLAFKAGFLHRAIVNEYAEMIGRMICSLSGLESRKKNKYELIVSHDIDHVHYSKRFRLLIADLVYKKSLYAPLKRIKVRGNAFDTFTWLMDLSEKYGTVSRFYFIPSHKERDADYSLSDPFIKKTVSMILERDHIIGLHPGYYTFNDAVEWRKQKTLLDESFNIRVKEGRQHCLRFEVPLTWKIWEQNEMEVDCTLGYASQPGFRCGTANAFHVFDLKERKVMNLKERPLIIMDVSLQSEGYKKMSMDLAYETIRNFKGVCKKYQMPFSILFHNSSFEPVHWGKEWTELYELALSC